jgi:hypothetical protein
MTLSKKQLADVSLSTAEESATPQIKTGYALVAIGYYLHDILEILRKMEV